MIELKTSILIVPKDIDPEEVIRLADSLPVENVTIIVGSTSIVQNQVNRKYWTQLMTSN